MLLKYLKGNKRFIFVIAIFHLFFFLLALHYKRIYMGDSAEYIYEALNIKNMFFFYSGNPVLPIESEFMTQRQPLYPIFLLVVYFFKVNNWIVLILQNILSIFNIAYCRKVLIDVGFNKKYDWLLLLLFVTYPAQFINANTIAPDILLQTFILIYFGCFVQLLRTKELRYALYISLSLVAGMLVKPVFYPFVIIHFLIILVSGFYIKLKIQRRVIFAILPICFVLIYNYSNYLRTGKFHFSSNQAFNAVYYFSPFINSKFGADSAAKYLLCERRNMALMPEYKDRYDYANERGLELLKQNFLSYTAYHLLNSLRMFIEPGKAEFDLFTGKLTYGKLYNKKSNTGFYAKYKEGGINGIGNYIKQNISIFIVAIVFLFNCIKIIGLYFFIKYKNTNKHIKIFVSVLVLYFVFVAGPITNTRYFLPVSLIVAGCAAVGYISKFQQNRIKIE